MFPTWDNGIFIFSIIPSISKAVKSWWVLPISLENILHGLMDWILNPGFLIYQPTAINQNQLRGVCGFSDCFESVH